MMHARSCSAPLFPIENAVDLGLGFMNCSSSNHLKVLKTIATGFKIAHRHLPRWIQAYFRPEEDGECPKKLAFLLNPNRSLLAPVLNNEFLNQIAHRVALQLRWKQQYHQGLVERDFTKYAWRERLPQPEDPAGASRLSPLE